MYLRKVDIRLPGKGNTFSHGARPVHLTITMIKWIRTSRLSIKNSLSLHLLHPPPVSLGTGLLGYLAHTKTPSPMTLRSPLPSKKKSGVSGAGAWRHGLALRRGGHGDSASRREREFFIDSLLVRIHFIIVMIRWTGLAPWVFTVRRGGHGDSASRTHTHKRLIDWLGRT